MNWRLDVLCGEAAAETHVLEDGVYLVGRGGAARIRLPSGDVSERHAFLVLRDGAATVEDLGSANGTFVDGAAVDGVVPVRPGALVQIGSCTLRVSPADAAEEAPCALPDVPPPPPEAPAPAVNEQDAAILRAVKRQIHDELLSRLDVKRLSMTGVDHAGFAAKARETIHAIVDQVQRAGKMPDGIDPARVEHEVYDEALGLGPVEDLLADDTVTEIMINGAAKIYVERAGRLQLTDFQFIDDASVMAVIERIVSPLGRRIDESQPYVDARLADGSRVNAIIPPLSLSGPTLTIRKFAKKRLGVEDFIRFGTWTRNAAEFLRACVMLRKNVVVSGGTGSGKTTLLNLLSDFIPGDERIVTVEDAAELRLHQPHVVRLEARPPNVEGRGAITIRDLVKNCLRMRPDRIIVGECRGGEALDMLQAMNTGHDGSLTTVHANSPRDVVSRLETMVLMSGMDLPSRAIREQIASAVDVIVHESRLSDGSRKVTAISEVTGMEGQQIVMQDLFAFEQTGVDAHGRVLGNFRPTGAVPTFYRDFAARGLLFDVAVFDPQSTREVRLGTVERT